MGIERTAFGGLVFVLSFMVVAKAYWVLPIILMVYFMARWLTKSDGQFMAIFLRFLDEGNVYDATPRASDFESRPKGWGKGVPL